MALKSPDFDSHRDEERQPASDTQLEHRTAFLLSVADPGSGWVRA